MLDIVCRLVLFGFTAAVLVRSASLPCSEYQPSIMPLPESSGCSRLDDIASGVGTCTGDHYTCSSRPDALTWSVVDNLSGHVDVFFPLPDPACKHTNYTVELKLRSLQVDSEMDEEACASAGDRDFRVTHSWRKYTVDDGSTSASMEAESRPPCQETGMVSFQFVFTGCYQVIINPYVGSNTQRAIHSCPHFIRSGYKKLRINEVVPTFNPQYRYQDLDSPVSITFAPLACNHLHMEVKLMGNVSGGPAQRDDSWTDCYKSGSVHSSCSIGPNQTAKCERVDCSIEADKISCLFSDVVPGNYCVRLRVYDDRCESDTLWTMNSDERGCSWHQAFNATADASSIDTQVAPSGEPSPSYAIAGALVLVALASAVAVVLVTLKYYTRRRKKQNLSVLPVAQSPEQLTPIVLLYARDCQPFMQLMTSFRLFLEDVTMCEVYDVFDAHRWSELSRSPVEWTRRLVCRKDAKIIVVATKCALLRQQAHLDHTTIQYKQPASTDDLFLFALQALTDKMAPDVYQRLSVVRFDGFAEDSDLLEHLNSYTRFVLPAHLDRLLHHLQSSFSDQNSRLMETEEVQNICQDLTSLLNYKNQNPHYLRNLLRLQRS